MAHIHSDHAGLQCSCCNPIWKALIPKVDLGELLDKEIATTDESPQPIIFSTVFPEGAEKPSDYQSPGYIQTLEGGMDKTADAVGIKDGYIHAVGKYNDVMNSMPKNTEVKYIYNGQTLLPGFIEPHIHIIPSAVVDMATDVGPYIGQELRSNVETDPKEKYCKDWVFETLRKAGEKVTGEGWIFGRNVDPSLLLDDDKAFDAELLNKYVSSDKPVFLMNSSMHLAYLNKVGVNLVNANLMNGEKPVNEKKEKPVKEQKPVNENGILIEESQFVPVLELIAYHYFFNEPYKDPKPAPNSPDLVLATDSDQKPTLKDLDLEKAAAFLGHLNEKVDAIFDTASSRGVTYVFDAGVEPTRVSMETYLLKTRYRIDLDQAKYLEYKANHNCKVRIGGALIALSLDDFKTKIREEYKPNQGDDKFNLAYVKVITDGSNQGLTGYLETPYDCDQNYLVYREDLPLPDIKNQTNVGVFNLGYPVELTALIRHAAAANWPAMIHANGDHAIERTISAFRAAGITNSTVNKRRDRIEHCSLLSDQNLIDMQALGVSPSFLIGHVGYWGWVFQQTILGQQRSNQLDRCGSALNDHNMRITLHSDYGVSPIGPLRMMEQSITRVMEGAPKKENKPVLNDAERITRFQALKAMTYDAAWQCHADQWVGSLEKDKCADFVLLEVNPLTYREEEGTQAAKGMRDIPVLETWKGGIQRFSNQKSITV